MQIFRDVINTGIPGLLNNGGGYREVRYTLLHNQKKLLFYSSSADFIICASCGRYSSHNVCCDPPKWVAVKNFLPMGEEVELESLPYGIQNYINNMGMAIKVAIPVFG